MKKAVPPKDNIALVFGEGETQTVAGRTVRVRFLSVNDLIEVQNRIGGMDEFNVNDLTHMRLILYLIFRKSDPDLTEEQIETEDYRLTENEVGRTFTLKHLKSPEMKSFLNYVFIGSGLKADESEEESASPNDPAAEVAPT